MNPPSASPTPPTATEPPESVPADWLELLTRMLTIRSHSGHEAELAAYLVTQMASRGFHASIDEAGNAIGVRGPSSSSNEPTREIILLGHMDTVPGDVPVRREGDLLFGRGAVDAKGPLAAFVIAGSLALLPPQVRLVVAGAVEEESASSRGARHLAAMRRPDACIIGEPSGWDGVTLGYKGRLLVNFELQRESSHSAGPEPSVGDIASRWWERVRTEAESLPASVSASQNPLRAFDRVQATLRSISTSSDGLHDRVNARAGFRLPPGVAPDDLRRICLAHADAATLTFEGAEHAFASDRGNAAARAISNAIRDEGATPRPKLKTGTSDMNIVGPIWSCPIVAYGPGDSALDHTPNEHLALHEFALSCRVLIRAIESLAATLAAPIAAPIVAPIINEPQGAKAARG